MAKVTLGPSCIVSEATYKKVMNAHPELKKNNLEALRALFTVATKGGAVTDRKHITALNKYSLAGKDGVVLQEILDIVKHSIRGSDYAWTRDLEGRVIARFRKPSEG